MTLGSITPLHRLDGSVIVGISARSVNAAVTFRTPAMQMLLPVAWKGLKLPPYEIPVSMTLVYHVTERVICGTDVTFL